MPTADWMVSTTWALPAVVFVDVWQWTPFVTLILLSGMQSVSVEVTEAAELDGPDRVAEAVADRHAADPAGGHGGRADPPDRLHPHLRPHLRLTRGGPGTATEVLSIFSYVTGFTAGDMGSAAAIAWVTVILVNILVAIFLRALSKSVS